MTHNIPVTCTVDPAWNPSSLPEIDGMLIDIISVEDNSGKLTPVGIVLLEDNTFRSVPMEFITKKIYL